MPKPVLLQQALATIKSLPQLDATLSMGAAMFALSHALADWYRPPERCPAVTISGDGRIYLGYMNEAPEDRMYIAGSAGVEFCAADILFAVEAVGRLKGAADMAPDVAKE